MKYNPILEADNFKEVEEILKDFRTNPSKYDKNIQRELIALEKTCVYMETARCILITTGFCWIQYHLQAYIRGPVHEQYIFHLAPQYSKYGTFYFLIGACVQVNVGFATDFIITFFFWVLTYRDDLFPIVQDFFMAVVENINTNRDSVVTQKDPVFLNHVVDHPDYTD